MLARQTKEEPQPRRDARPPSRPVQRTSAAPVAHPSSPPGRVAWWLWVLFAGSLVFFALVRVYVRGEDAKLALPLPMVPYLQTSGPAAPVRAGAIDLTWNEVPGATTYRLNVYSVTGLIVVDSLPVDGTEWIPPDDALPALVRGEYRWSVEALDDRGRLLAKSAEGTFLVM